MYTLLLQVTTTPVSMSDTVMVDTNVDAVLETTDREGEREVQEEIESRFFKPLPTETLGILAGNETRCLKAALKLFRHLK